jgi:hypothetical protein
MNAQYLQSSEKFINFSRGKQIPFYVAITSSCKKTKLKLQLKKDHPSFMDILITDDFKSNCCIYGLL